MRQRRSSTPAVKALMNPSLADEPSEPIADAADKLADALAAAGQSMKRHKPDAARRVRELASIWREIKNELPLLVAG